jgi:endonuclease-3
VVQKAKNILRLLRKQWPVTRCELLHKNPLELMVGVILSAQSTDQRVNSVTRGLFRKYHTAAGFAASNPAVFEKEIRSTGFFRSKTRSIRSACRVLVERFKGKVPKTMDELLDVPGIGRKSANVLLGAAYGIASGVVVDTHMIRLSHRLGLSKQEDPVKIEMDLNKLIPSSQWIFFSQAMVLHGRYICIARRPRCWECELINVCPYSDKVLSPDKDEATPPRTTISGLPVHVRK